MDITVHVPYTALRRSVVRVPMLAKLVRRAPNEHDHSAFARGTVRVQEPTAVCPHDEERRRHVRQECPLPLREAHLHERHMPRLVVRVADHHDLMPCLVTENIDTEVCYYVPSRAQMSTRGH